MRYLVARSPEGPVAVGEEEKWAQGGEPVVPAFPAPIEHVFLTVPGWKHAMYAVVADVDVDPDELAAAMCEEYPGLPECLHETYVLATGKAALTFPLGTTLRISITEDSATLYPMLGADGDGEAEGHTLWTQQPLR
jgi:hypothetical protein